MSDSPPTTELAPFPWRLVEPNKRYCRLLDAAGQPICDFFYEGSGRGRSASLELAIAEFVGCCVGALGEFGGSARRKTMTETTTKWLYPVIVVRGHKSGWFRIGRPGKAGACPWYFFPLMWLWIKLP